MIHTQLKFEAKVPNGSKVVAFTRNHTKFLCFKANLTLKVKVTQFKCKVKFQMGQSKSLKQIFCKFEGQFDHQGQGHWFDQFDLKDQGKDQGQGHHFSNPSETFKCSINSSSWTVKFERVLFLKVKTKIWDV